MYTINRSKLEAITAIINDTVDPAVTIAGKDERR